MINNLICVNFNYSLGQTIYLIGKMTFDLVVTISMQFYERNQTRIDV